MIDFYPPRRQINGETGKTQGRCIVRVRYRPLACCLLSLSLVTLGASQDGAHAADQFTRAERLDEVVIRAYIQSRNTVILVATCCKHEYGRFRPGTYTPA